MKGLPVAREACAVLLNDAIREALRTVVMSAGLPPPCGSSRLFAGRGASYAWRHYAESRRLCQQRPRRQVCWKGGGRTEELIRPRALARLVRLQVQEAFEAAGIA